MNPSKNLKITIYGRFASFWLSFFLVHKAERKGLEVVKSQNKNTSYGEILLSGNEKELWEFISLLKRPVFFVKLDKIVFQFI